MYVVGKNFGGVHTGLTIVSVDGNLYGTYVDESCACHMINHYLKQGRETTQKTVEGLSAPVNVFDI